MELLDIDTGAVPMFHAPLHVDMTDERRLRGFAP